MTEHEIFNRLFSGGRYALPYLVELSHPELETIRLANTLQDVTYNGNTYTRASFSYKEPDIEGKGATLSAAIADNKTIEFLDAADWRMEIKVIEVMAENGSIVPLNVFKHMFAICSWGSDMKLEMQLQTDDRKEMNFPPFIFDSDNNRGGA